MQYFCRIVTDLLTILAGYFTKFVVGGGSESRDQRHLDLECFCKKSKILYFAVFLGASKVLFPGVPGLCPLIHGKTRPLTTHDGHNHRCCLLFVSSGTFKFDFMDLCGSVKNLFSKIKFESATAQTNSKQHR